MSNGMLASDALLPCSSQFFPAGGELPFSSPRSCPSCAAHDIQPVLDSLIAQVKLLPAGLAADQVAAAAGSVPTAAKQQLRRTTSQGAPGVSASFDDLLPLQQRAQQHLAALQAGASVSALLSLPSESVQLSAGGATAARVFGSRPTEAGKNPLAAVSASTGGSSRKPLQLHPLLEHQEQEQQEELLQSPSQSPSKQLSVMLLPGISCDAGSAAGAGERMAKSAPSSPDSHPRFARSASAAVRSSLGAESTLQAQSSKDLIPAYHGLHVGTGESSERRGQQKSTDGAGKGESSNWLAQLMNRSGNTPRAVYADMQQLQNEVSRLTAANLELEDLLHRTRSSLAEAHMQLADKKEQLRAARGSLAASQEQLGATRSSLLDYQNELVDVQASLAETHRSLADCQAAVKSLQVELEVADKAKLELAQQLEHMTAKVRAQEDQLDFAHQQLDARQQELRANMDVASSARTTTEQLQQQLQAAKDELSATRRELDAVTRRLTSEANDAKRAGDEASSLKRENAQLQGELNRSRQELYEAKEQLRQLQADAERRTAQLEGQVTGLSQQLAVLKERAAAMQSQTDRLHDQLVAAEGDNSTLRADVANLLGSRQEAAALREQLHHAQLDSNRHIADVEANAAELSQQLMFMRSQNERLGQQLQAAEGNTAALSADLDSARFAASSANKALHDAQMQQQHMQQQHQAQLRQMQQHSRQQLQQLQDRLEQQHQVQLRQVHTQMQLQHQMQRAAADAAQQQYAPVMPSGFDLVAGYPGVQPALRAPRKLTFEDEMPLALGSPSHHQPHLMASSFSPGRTADTYAEAGYAAYPGRSSSAEPWQPHGSAYFGAGRPAGSVGPVSGPVSPDGKLSHISGSPVRAPAAAAAATGPMGFGSGSRGATAADSQPWFAGGPRPDTAPPSSSRTGPQQQQAQQQSTSATAAAGAGSAMGPVGSSPFGTESTAQEVMAQTKHLEAQLLALCQEKDELSREYAKMPLGSGKTIRERQRKAAVEKRLEEVDALISRTRMSLKRILGR